MMLFEDQLPLIDQILSRLRTVYCKIHSDDEREDRTLLLLDRGETYHPAIPPFEVDEGDQYDIVFAEETRRRAAPSSESSQSTHSSAKEEVPPPPLPYDWAIYLDRALLKEQKGNLVVSITMNATRRAFGFTVFDLRSFREVYTFLSFRDACEKRLLDRDIGSLMEELDHLDESVAFDVVDELMSRVDVHDNEEDGGLRISIVGEDGASETVLARLEEHETKEEEEEEEVLAMKRQSVVINSVTVQVLGAANLVPANAISSR